MALDFKEPKPFYIFYNKETAKFEIPTEGGEPTIISGIEGYLVGMRTRVQTYEKFDDVTKCDFVFQDGDDTYIVPFGTNTFVVRWAAYMVIHELVDLSKPIGFTLSKKPDATVVIPHWYQDKTAINISSDTWKTFPRTTVRKTEVIDWLKVFGTDDMTAVVEQANACIAQARGKSWQPADETVVVHEEEVIF